MTGPTKPLVGALRPSQLLFTYGAGAVVDLPRLSALVLGLEDWPEPERAKVQIREDRLLAAVRRRHGDQVAALCAPPEAPDLSPKRAAFESANAPAVPTAVFPRWMRCTWCRRMAPVEQGLFKLEVNAYYPDQTRYVHASCSKPGKRPAAVPVRFVSACRRGHLDDFPWRAFVHYGKPVCDGILELNDHGLTGDASDVTAKCGGCGASMTMAAAFGDRALQPTRACTARRPHLHDSEASCEGPAKTILLGASNFWFPVVFSAIALPERQDAVARAVAEHWGILEGVPSAEILRYERTRPPLKAALEGFADADLLRAMEDRRRPRPPAERPLDLRTPEYEAFSNADPAVNDDDFKLSRVAAPREFAALIESIVLVERVREVRALLGFTRVFPPGEGEDGLPIADDSAPISKNAPTWLPASEVRGEGIFIRLSEAAVRAWCEGKTGVGLDGEFRTAQEALRRSLPPHATPPRAQGVRYVLIHSLAHALLRAVAEECGYGLASVRERLYVRGPNDPRGPAAGLLLYTAAPDSDGTLGGLVRLGRPENLARLLAAAREHARLCSSDPLCSEHAPKGADRKLHGAACHACLFVPETSCERGNRFLDRRALVETFTGATRGFMEIETP